MPTNTNSKTVTCDDSFHVLEDLTVDGTLAAAAASLATLSVTTLTATTIVATTATATTLNSQTVNATSLNVDNDINCDGDIFLTSGGLEAFGDLVTEQAVNCSDLLCQSLDCSGLEISGDVITFDSKTVDPNLQASHGRLYVKNNALMFRSSVHGIGRVVMQSHDAAIITSSYVQVGATLRVTSSSYLIGVTGGEMYFVDPVVGTVKLSELLGVKLVYIKATGQSEGDLHLSDGTNWDVSKALIKEIVLETSSTDWDLYLLQNDNGYATDDATIPKRKLVANANGNKHLVLDICYEDEDDSGEVHLYYLDNSGSNTATIIILGTKGF